MISRFNWCRTFRRRSFVGALSLLVLSAGLLGGWGSTSLAAAATVAGCGSTLAIGVQTSASGPAAQYGQSTYDAAQIWAKKVNASGGINGAKVTLVERDDAYNPATSVQVARYLSQVADVKFVLGPLAPAVIGPAAPVYTQAGIPELAADAENTTFDANSPSTATAFTTGSSRNPITAAVFNYLEKKGITKVGFIGSTDVVGVGVESSFKQYFDGKHGPKDVGGIQLMSPTATEVVPQIQALKNAGAQVVYVGVTLPTEQDIVLNAIESIHWTVPVTGPFSVGQGVTWTSYPNEAKISFYPQYLLNMANNKAAAPVDKLLASTPELDQAMFTYLDGLILQKVFTEAKSCSTKKVLGELRHFKGTVLGMPIQFTPGADRFGPTAASLVMASTSKVGAYSQAVPVGS
jgi:ABC-type branched-subunit amino acid transport system substrate-binding protein